MKAEGNENKNLTNEQKIESLIKLIKNSGKIVFFGGAGVSTESGIPDFRSTDGLYNMEYDYPPETILSATFFRRQKAEFYRFYQNKMLCLDVEPNITHKVLAKLEECGKLTAVITQNIDGLHQLAGSKKVYELHGSVHRNYCLKCGKFFDAAYIKNGVYKSCAHYTETGKNEAEKYIPVCDECGGILKPDVVLYEEGLDNDIVNGAVKAINEADTLIVGGTSLSVYPAAGLIRYFKGDNLILINKSSTQYDNNADLLINAGLGEIFSRIKEECISEQAK